ncbi:hypothetical protein ACHWQZ_G003343 [Mnemiopsis leidyi]
MESGPTSPIYTECKSDGTQEPQTPTKNRKNKSSGYYSPHLRRSLAGGTGSPSKEKSCDRFIPTRNGAKWENSFSLTPETQSENGDEGREQHTYRCLLQNELLGADIDDIRLSSEDGSLQRTPHKRRLFHYQSPSREPQDHGYSLSPVSRKSQKLLTSPKKSLRKIPRLPYKVLDAPELQDDFYLNLVDWSYFNVLTVGLSASVYLWSACTSQVTRLCDLSCEGDTVTSVGWSDRSSNILAVGTNRGCVQLWDTQAQKRTAIFESHESRAGALAWNGDLLCSGSRDRFIIQRDVRTPPHQFKKLTGHKQEVCGLKWSPDRQHLASGGNDNKLFVWNQSSLAPVQKYSDHVAAVKAIAWSPHQHGLLASGGGTADQYIRFWNTLTGQPLQSVHTGSQVCNLAWSKTTHEFVSTHGYSQHQILVWKYPSLQQVVCLTGHHCRVLYLAMSPDGQSIVTGAGDETLRFWNVFNKSRLQKESRSALNLFSSIR